MKDKLQSYPKFLGGKVVSLTVASIFLGISWFGVESTLLIVLQALLRSLGFQNTTIVSIPDSFPSDFKMVLVLLLFYGILRAILMGLNRFLPSYVCQVFIREQRRRLARIAMFSEHGRTNSSLVDDFNENVTKAGFFLENFASLVVNIVSLVLLLFLCLRQSPTESIVSFGFLALCVPFVRIANKMINSYGNRIREQWNLASNNFQLTLKNIFFIKIHRLEMDKMADLDSCLDEYLLGYKRYGLWSALVSALPFFIGVLVVCVVALVYYYRQYSAETNFLAFIYLFIRCAQSASSVSSAMSGLVFHFPFFKQLKASFDELSVVELSAQSSGPDIPFSNGINIILDSVSFAYDNQVVIPKINFSAKTHDVILIKGKSGSGKSTFLKLVLGVTSPKTGSILINDIPPDVFFRKYRGSIGYVGTEPYLLPGTLRDNLLAGNDREVTKEEILDVLTDVGLSCLIQRLDEELLDDAAFSTGQKQRVSFARAFLRKPSIMILDEATANVDSETESLMLRMVQKLTSNALIFIVSHRNSFDAVSTQCLHFRDGRISYA